MSNQYYEELEFRIEMLQKELVRLRKIEEAAKYVAYKHGHYEFCYQVKCICGVDELNQALETK